MIITGTPPNGGQFPCVVSIPEPGGSVSNAAMTANNVMLVRLRVTKPVTISTLSIYVNTAAGNTDLGFYTSPDGGTTMNLAAHTGSTAVAGTNVVQTIALLVPITLQPGIDYWIAAGFDGAPSIGREAAFAATSVMGKRICSKGSAWSSGLPATINSPGGNTVVPWIYGE